MLYHHYCIQILLYSAVLFVYFIVCNFFSSFIEEIHQGQIDINSLSVDNGPSNKDHYETPSSNPEKPKQISQSNINAMKW